MEELSFLIILWKPQGRKLLAILGNTTREAYLLMDKAHEGYTPVVPPKSNRKNPWKYDKKLYKLCNQAERLFRGIKRFSRIFTRYNKLDIMFLPFIFPALIFDTLR